MLKLTFFGSPQICNNDRTLTTDVTGRMLGLFAYLLLEDGPHDRGLLADLLWSDLSEKQAKSNLRYVLYDLRKVLGEYLIVTRQTIAFNSKAQSWVDASVFSLFMETEFPAADPTIIHEVLNLYKGDLLAGLYIQDAPNFEQWLEQERRHFREQATQTWLHLCKTASGSGNYDFGIMAGRELLKLDPGSETAHRLIMQQLAYTGQRTAALAQFALCQEELEREYDVPPDEQTTNLFYQIQRGEIYAPALFLAADERDIHVSHEEEPVYVESARHITVNWEHIPQCHHFVGRAEEKETVTGWVEQDRYQVIGLYGLPGVGKSALAAELVSILDEQRSNQAVPAFEHIIWHSALGFSGLLELLQTWYKHFDSVNEPPASVEACLKFLLSRMRDHRILFILDDLESVLALGYEADALDVALESRSGGYYWPEWQAMGELFRRVAQVDHGSCLLVQSNVVPYEWQTFARENSSVRQLTLTGLRPDAATDLLNSYGIQLNDVEQEKTVALFMGHPQLIFSQLKMAQEFGLNFESSSLSSQGIREEVYRLLLPTFQCLTLVERETLLRIFELLAPNGGRSCSVQEFLQQIDGHSAISTYLQVLNSLQRYHLLEIHGPQKIITLPRLIEQFLEHYLHRSISNELQLLVQDHRRSYMRHAGNLSEAAMEDRPEEINLATGKKFRIFKYQ